jgi:hypothetical protein
MKSEFVALLAFGLLMASACQNDTKSSTEKLAGAVCDCTSTSNLVELNTLAEKAMQGKDSTATSDVDRLMESISREHQRINTCMQPAVQTFGVLKKQDVAQFSMQLMQTCPKLDTLLASYATDLISGGE